MLYSLCRDGGILLVSFVAARSDFEHFAFCFGSDRKFFDHLHFGQEQEPQMSVCAFYIQASNSIIFFADAHLIIFSLSMTNLTVCLVLVPVMIFDFLNKSNWELSEELCSISSLVGYGNGPTSIILIALLSLTR